MIKPSEIELGDKIGSIVAAKSGKITRIINESIVRIAKAAGAPKAKGSGVILPKKLGEPVKKNDTILEIYAERKNKLKTALKLANKLQPIVLNKKIEDQMLLDKIPKKFSNQEQFMIER